MASKNSPSNTNGLGSGIGTFTHTEYHPEARPTRREASLADLARRIRCIKRDISRRLGQITLTHPIGACQVLYCPICGDRISYQGEDATMWGKRRKCDACQASGRTTGEIRHCRQCGTAFPRPEGISPKGWGTLSLCPACRQSPRPVEAEVIVPEDSKLAGLRSELEELMARWQTETGGEGR